MTGRTISRVTAWLALVIALAAPSCAPIPRVAPPVPPVAPSGAVAQVAYVSVRGDGRVAVYDVDGSTGELTLKQVASAGEGEERWALSAPITISPDGTRLDVGLRSSGGIATYGISADGTLSFLKTTDIGGSAPFLTREATGRWLLAAYYQDGKVSVHRVAEDGTVQEGPVEEIRTALNAHSVLLDRTGRFAFVPHTGPNAIYQFRFDAEGGRLDPGAPPLVQPPEGRGPRHSRFHPTLPVAYVINETGSTITAYDFDERRGTLAAFQELSTLPRGHTGNNSTADLHLTPDGRFLYGSNRGHDSLAAYRVDPGTGRLEAIGWFATEPTPRAFAIDATGRFLYVAGQASGNVGAYRIDPATGRLARFATYAVGEAPTWIEFLTIEEAP